MARESKKIWPCTISSELHEAWKKLRRTGDPDAIAKHAGVSRPVIDRALNHGYVTLANLPDKINAYFTDRQEKEKGEAAKLLGQTAE